MPIIGKYFEQHKLNRASRFKPPPGLVKMAVE